MLSRGPQSAANKDNKKDKETGVREGLSPGRPPRVKDIHPHMPAGKKNITATKKKIGPKDKLRYFNRPYSRGVKDVSGNSLKKQNAYYHEDKASYP